MLDYAPSQYRAAHSAVCMISDNMKMLRFESCATSYEQDISATSGVKGVLSKPIIGVALPCE